MDDVSPGPHRRLAVVLFDGFELLDVFGPLEVFGALRDGPAVTMVGPAPGPVASAQGPRAGADVAYADAEAPDIVLVAGRREFDTMLDQPVVTQRIATAAARRLRPSRSGVLSAPRG